MYRSVLTKHTLKKPKMPHQDIRQSATVSSDDTETQSEDYTIIMRHLWMTPSLKLLMIKQVNTARDSQRQSEDYTIIMRHLQMTPSLKQLTIKQVKQPIVRCWREILSICL